MHLYLSRQAPPRAPRFVLGVFYRFKKDEQRPVGSELEPDHPKTRARQRRRALELNAKTPVVKLGDLTGELVK